MGIARMDVIIEKMNEGDLIEVVDMEKEVFADPWPLGAFKYDLQNNFALVLVARLDGRVAGYANVYIIEEEVQIGNIAVAPDYRQRGIGSRIIDYVIAEATRRKSGYICLEVRQSNEAAQKLYQKFGFEITGRRKLYYRHPKEDALVMVREMN